MRFYRFTRLGYFIGLNKSMLEPCQVVKFLGMLVDTSKQTFRIPNDKKVSFRLLRESMLEKISIDIKTLQRFAGKCISLMLAVPGAKLYIREVNKAISICTKNSRVIQMTGDLCEEIKHWRFLDEWDGFVPWRGGEAPSDRAINRCIIVQMGCSSRTFIRDIGGFFPTG